jgi:ABC-type antimicrobial peptide transport system permease subunit
MALGAQSAAVRWMIVREATVTVVAGTIAGLIGTLGAERLVRNHLFGVQPHDPITLASAMALLLAMALVAAYLPARRAARNDPHTSLYPCPPCTRVLRVVRASTVYDERIPDG